MSWHVRVEPSGHEFLAEAHESLLDAALRAGLNLRYNCNNGTCGECQARLMSGTLGSVRAHDFRLGEAQKGLGRFLLCSASAASDLVIEVQELHAASDIPLQRIATRVAKVERLGNYAVLQLRTPRVQTLSFLAGQAADVMIDGHVRRLAIASFPAGVRLACRRRGGCNGSLRGIPAP
jgi:CDP-4-dehydro-6-deoxyglucose reductase